MSKLEPDDDIRTPFGPSHAGTPGPAHRRVQERAE
jgi:hypothetical protein